MHHTENKFDNPCENKASGGCSIFEYILIHKKKEGIRTSDAFQQVYTRQDLQGEGKFSIR